MSTVADGPEMNVSGRVGSSFAIASGSEPNELVGADDAQVIVGHQRQDAPAHARPAVEDDRAALRDRDGARRDHAVRLVECVRIQRGLVAQRLDAIDPCLGNAFRDGDPAHAAVVKDCAHRFVELGRRRSGGSGPGSDAGGR